MTDAKNIMDGTCEKRVISKDTHNYNRKEIIRISGTIYEDERLGKFNTHMMKGGIERKSEKFS